MAERQRNWAIFFCLCVIFFFYSPMKGFTISSVRDHNSFILGWCIYLLLRRMLLPERLNVPVWPSLSLLRSSWIAVSAPCRGVRMNGRNTRSVMGSKNICIVIIFVLTMPGSAAFTVMPFSLTRRARSSVKSVMANLVLL